MLNFLQRLYVWWTLPAYQPARSLVCNDSGAEHIRVNLTVAVNAAQIRREQREGREVLILPSFTLPDNVVMNGGLYPHEEIEKSYATLEGTLAPLGHPVVNGTYVPAGTPAAIHKHHIGAWNENVRRVGNRIGVDKVVDVEYAKNTEGGRRLLEAVEAGAPIHTSTGIFMNRDMQANGKGYAWTARDMVMDHDAILLDEVGAATPEQGVGLLVNSRVEEAVELSANEEGIVNRILQLIGLKVNSEPVSTPPSAEGETEMTPEELAAALTANRTETLAAVKALLDPVAASVTQLQANHTALADTLTANSRAAEADKRTKVAEVIGEEAAKALTGNALDTAYAKLVGAAPIVPGFTGNAADGYQTTKLPE